MILELCLENVQREVSFNVNVAEDNDQRQPNENRVTCISVVSASVSSGHQPIKCTVVAGVLNGCEGSPYMAVYDVVWTRAQQQEVESDLGPSTSSSNSSGPTIKKGGTTKKVLPTPHVLNQNSSG